MRAIIRDLGMALGQALASKEFMILMVLCPPLLIVALMITLVVLTPLLIISFVDELIKMSRTPKNTGHR
jgi:hypothetical protein